MGLRGRRFAPIAALHLRPASVVFISTAAARSRPRWPKATQWSAAAPRFRGRAAAEVPSSCMLVTAATYRRYRYTLYNGRTAQSFPGALQLARYRFSALTSGRWPKR